MWKSFENALKNTKVLTRESTNQDIKPFKIKQDKDFYFYLTLGENGICYTKSQEDAEAVAQGLKRLHKWSKNSMELGVMQKENYTVYQTLRPVLKKYGVKHRENGNYLSTLVDGQVTYNTKILRSTGTHIVDGLVYKDGYLFLPYLKFNFGTIQSKEAAILFAEFAKIINWSHEKLADVINTEQILNELKRLKTLAEAGEIGQMNVDVEDQIETIIFEDVSTEQKMVLREVLSELDGLIGLKVIKHEVQNLIRHERANRRLRSIGIKTSNSDSHSLFIGSAGTGKTVVARMYADILWSLNKIPERKLVEVSKEDLVSPYVGETEVKTKEVIEKALGGVLFVDEAYMLAGSTNPQGNDYGKIALEIIMRAMENERGNLVVVFAGYENDIEKLLDTNEGLRSRFSRKFRFEDYSPKELAKIAHIMIQAEGFETNDVEKEIEELMNSQYKSNQLSGNARAVRKIASEIVSNHKIRMVEKNGSFYKINPEDVKVIGKRKTGRSEETMLEMQKRAIEKLTNLVGLGKLKEEIKTWSNYIKIEKKREELNLNSDIITLHMTFKGAPGTGKTTVARIMGDILQSNGLLSRGHFKEVTRSDLVAEYMGQTSVKVKKLFKEMEGGILFIDEAYSLVQDENDSFGKEAVDTIIAEMENRRDDLVVILAGYSNKIEKLLETNPGFNSRINNHFEFPDYNSIELYELLKLTMKGRNLKLSPEAKVEVKKYIQMEKEQNKVDGNGRWVRNLVDKMKKNQANRLSRGNEFTEEKLITIEKEDVSSI